MNLILISYKPDDMLFKDGEIHSFAVHLLENGADLVIGTHPHVIEPVEMLTDENGNEMLVYYSIGNYVNGIFYVTHNEIKVMV